MLSIHEFNSASFIKAVFLDFDGVFTDNSVSVDENGMEYVRCSRYDGFGISSLQKSNIFVHVISTETRPLALKRCQKLKIPCSYGINNKLNHALDICSKIGFSLSQICFFGNDINDLELLDKVKFPVITPDSHPSVRKSNFYVTSLTGGNGCVRELSDFLLTNNQFTH